jgi:hypothetical protein
MGIMGAILGSIGGLAAVMGIVTALEVIPLITPQLTWTFWFVLSAILFLAAITFLLGREEY